VIGIGLLLLLVTGIGIVLMLCGCRRMIQSRSGGCPCMTVFRGGHHPSR
jgi:hypothetical protein